MLLRTLNASKTELDILLFLQTRPRSADDVRRFLALEEQKHASTYTGRMKAKNLIEKKDGQFTLTAKGEEILAQLKKAVT